MKELAEVRTLKVNRYMMRRQGGYYCLLVTYIACSAKRFGANLTGLGLYSFSGIRFSTLTFSSLQNRSKSFSERKCMFGESCQP